MEQPIVGYHKDEENHWVAKLVCGHNQHVRHDPPWSVREWTESEQGRKSMIGFGLNCVKCDEGAPRDWIFASPVGDASNWQLQRTNTILYCKRWSETTRFYRETLALTVTIENDWFVEFQLTETSFISIADSSRTTIKDVGGQGATLSLQVDRIDQAREKLLSSGVEAGNFQTKWGSRVFYVHDPEGHRIEFWQATEVETTADSYECDLDTSTTDWVIEHPQATAIFDELGIDYFCGGKSLEYASQERNLDPGYVYERLCLFIQMNKNDAQG